MTTQPEALRLAGALLEPVVLDKHAMQAAAELRRLHSECEALHKENEGQTRLNVTLVMENKELIAQREALRADAERWREARSMDGFSLDRMWDAAETEADIDAAMDKRIDAARAAKEKA